MPDSLINLFHKLLKLGKSGISKGRYITNNGRLSILIYRLSEIIGIIVLK